MFASASAILLPLVALLGASSAEARIRNITFPATAVIGQTIQANVTDLSYIQNNIDFGIIFGIKLQDLDSCKNCEGFFQSYTNIYNESKYIDSNGRRMQHYLVDVPIQTAYLNASQGQYSIIAGVPTFVGASGSTNIRYFNHTITLLPAKTSKKRMDDEEWAE